MREIKIVITGFGTVGYRTAKLLLERAERYRSLYQTNVRLIAVCGSTSGLYDPDGLNWDRLQPLTKQAGGVSGDPAAASQFTGASFVAAAGADVLIEAGPTNLQDGGAAARYMRAALQGGMHVIALSKGALVTDYPGLSRLAAEHGGVLKISGATAAALPTIDLLQYNLAGCRVHELTGIFTGTANYILSRMVGEGAELGEAVSDAQRKGIAEPDPRYDIDGWDTACKLTILANAGFQANIRLSQVERSGIGQITPEQIKQWRESGVVPKLTGRLRFADDKVQAEVGLSLYPLDHPLARVNGTKKAILVKTEEMGELFVAGGKSDPGAAAAAALKDLEHLLQRR
ncbi:homoserine dehydrogenase [Brevibacillus fulvus]|uniref:Homoserine dehydrogenase n=1 Tax=Brevibacillus fulvus TaxID=1125967 RepID=A0A938XZB8_9BACL|nr:homoserine dehydrogenase [Brevibacillus fulvus]MBM7590979.1 homoserine dehydrogenase [Brevibacillus fulvus]